VAIFAGTAAQTPAREPLFSDQEKAAVKRFWAEPGRYTESLPTDAAKNGPNQVRLTVAGSVWLREYNKRRGMGKVAPTTTAKPQNAAQRVWQAWIDAKIEHDRWVAMQVARKANSRVGVETSKFDDSTLPKSEPDDPGAAPADLASFAGEPPVFAEAVMPMTHQVKFADGTLISLNDNVRMRKNYAYYRFEKGVATGGTAVKNLPESELNRLCKMAGLAESEMRVMKAVSILEGGFDSVNTYDTGFVSVGFIQFACLQDGGNSLGALLKLFKERDPDDFAKDFRRFGIDVTEDAKIACVDPDSGEELIAGEAAMKMIEDRRLIAVFQYDGLKSDVYRAMQLRAARDQFFPAEDEITINVGGRSMTGKVCDILRSEAALATLMDRKVNTGKLDPLVSILQQCAAANNATSFEELSHYEYEIVNALLYRHNYLVDNGLTQPVSLERSRSLGSRGGDRTKRGGKTGGGSFDPNR
jgi:hypothetical protein